MKNKLKEILEEKELGRGVVREKNIFERIFSMASTVAGLLFLIYIVVLFLS